MGGVSLNQHSWVVKNQYGYATIYECEVCKCGRHYSWMPGWPGSYTYFTAKGNYTENKGSEEPPCTVYPVGGLFA